MPKEKACKLCARFAPNKCKRHGGEPAPKKLKPAGGGTRSKPAGKKPAAKKAPRVRETSPPASRVSIYEDALTALRAKRDVIDAAIAALSSLEGIRG